MRFPAWRRRRRRHYVLASYYRHLLLQAEANGRPEAEVKVLRKALRKAAKRM